MLLFFVFLSPRSTLSSMEFISFTTDFYFFTLSSRTERSVVKDLVCIHLFCVPEILRFAQDDKVSSPL